MRTWILVLSFLCLTPPTEAQQLLRDLLFLIFGKGPAQTGPYGVTMRDYELSTLDESSPNLVLVYPEKIHEEGNTETFPLLVFLHGFLGGAPWTYIGHKALLDGVASFGFIVAAPESCFFGCREYDQEALKIIDWVEGDNGVEALQFVNTTSGYGIFGHSMGGGATADVLNSLDPEYNFRAGVLLHSVPARTVDVTVPMAYFTGTSDECCGENAMRPMYDELVGVPKVFADMEGARHTEPNLFRSRWPAYVAAWFRIFLLGEEDGFYYDLIYSSEPDALCGGSIEMADCEIETALP